jgi:hypothetical protein
LIIFPSLFRLSEGAEDTGEKGRVQPETIKGSSRRPAGKEKGRAREARPWSAAEEVGQRGLLRSALFSAQLPHLFEVERGKIIMCPGGFDRSGVEAQIELRHRPIGVEFHLFLGGHAIPDSLERFVNIPARKAGQPHSPLLTGDEFFFGCEQQTGGVKLLSFRF